MNSALKTVLTPPTPGSQAPAVPPQMNKPMHPQGGPGPYGQQMPQNLMHGNPSPAHNMNPHQNHYSLNIPNSYAGNPQASSHPVTSSHPIANQAHVQPVSYSPPKSQVFNQSYQVQHNSNIPATQSLPATQAQTASEPEKPQSNGTADVGKSPAPPALPTKPEQNHVATPKKEVLQSPEKAKTSPDKPASSSSSAASSPGDVKPAEAKTPAIEPAEVPQNINVSTPATASTTATSASTTSSPTVPTTSSSSAAATVTKDPPTASAPTNTTAASSAPGGSIPSTAVTQQKVEPSVAATVESSTPASASSPTSSATTSTPPAPVAPSKPDAAEVPAPADPAPVTSSTEKPAADAPQEAQSTTSDASSSNPAKEKEPKATTTKSPMKVATTPRTPTRTKAAKSEPQESPKSSKPAAAAEPKASSSKSPGGGKLKRTRIRTQPYQSPLPELEIISKMTSASSTPRSRGTDEKLIIFYKNEFLAVRNSEGGFYVCQAVQNVYKSSPKIRIRWLSQEKGEKSGEIYTPDFYDTTDFDCILTNLNLERVDKGKYRLPAKEKERTDNILKRAIAVEKGEATSLDDSLTEDNPDGLDVSLYKDEEQLKKRKGTKRKAPKTPRSPTRTLTPRKSPENSKAPKVAPVKTPKAKTPRKVIVKKTPAAVVPVENKRTTPAVGRAERAKRRSGPETPVSTKSSPVVDQKKAKVLAKVVKRTAVASPKPPTTTPTNTPAKPAVKSTKQPVASTSKAKPVVTKTSPAPAVTTITPPIRRTKRTKK